MGMHRSHARLQAYNGIHISRAYNEHLRLMADMFAKPVSCLLADVVQASGRCALGGAQTQCGCTGMRGEGRFAAPRRRGNGRKQTNLRSVGDRVYLQVMVESGIAFEPKYVYQVPAACSHPPHPSRRMPRRRHVAYPRGQHVTTRHPPQRGSVAQDVEKAVSRLHVEGHVHQAVMENLDMCGALPPDCAMHQTGLRRPCRAGYRGAWNQTWRGDYRAA
jgi:hypothetical protein